MVGWGGIYSARRSSVTASRMTRWIQVKCLDTHKDWLVLSCFGDQPSSFLHLIVTDVGAGYDGSDRLGINFGLAKGRRNDYPGRAGTFCRNFS